MILRLKASLTVSDRFCDNSGNLVNMAQVLKSPAPLAEEWVRCVVRQGAPLTWRDAKEKYLECLGSIRTEGQVLQMKECYLQDLPSTLFGSRPLDTG